VDREVLVGVADEGKARLGGEHERDSVGPIGGCASGVQGEADTCGVVLGLGGIVGLGLGWVKVGGVGGICANGWKRIPRKIESGSPRSCVARGRCGVVCTWCVRKI
jgi:hypothetical protein